MFQLLLAIIYLAFISLGLPDSLLGAAWPSMYPELGVSVSFMGGISMIITAGTVISSLMCDRIMQHLNCGKITAISVGMTAVALFGFSVSHSYLALCLWAVPYGLGAGSVDASLNNYVALHYASRHMSWLHCMWGVGCSVSPYIMGYAISSSLGWNMGYRIISFLQIGLTAILIFSLPLWKDSIAKSADQTDATNTTTPKPLTLRQTIAIPGAKEVMITFFCYCALEYTCGQWASSYLVLNRGISPEAAASFAALFYMGITAGRFLSGFLTFTLNDTQMIRLGEALVFGGLILLLLPSLTFIAYVGFIMIGLGCAPIYPSVIHATPDHFGPERSQAMIGVQMASAYVGGCLMPPVFGLLCGALGVGLLPVYLFIILLLMVGMHEMLVQKTA